MEEPRSDYAAFLRILNNHIINMEVLLNHDSVLRTRIVNIRSGQILLESQLPEGLVVSKDEITLFTSIPEITKDPSYEGFSDPNTRPESEELLEGYYKGIYFVIVDMKTHPNAYIKYPSFAEFREELPHGGFTGGYENSHGILEGWDYAHGGDLFVASLDRQLISRGKRYTTNEILMDICRVIDRIVIELGLE